MKKRKWLGALLNFLVPGLGSAYARKWTKARITYPLFFLVVLSLRFIGYSYGLFLVWGVSVIAFYAYLIITGSRDVVVGKEYPPSVFDRMHVYVLIFFIHVTIVGSISGHTLDKLTPINFASIPTPAMDPTLKIGDIMAFEKTKKIIRNEVTLFWHLDDRLDDRIMYVKRCIGMPGENIQIKGGEVFINGNHLINTVELKFRYLVTTNGDEISPRILKEFEFEESEFAQLSLGVYSFYLTSGEAKKLSELKFLKVVQEISGEGEQERVYPHSDSLGWNTDFYGPIYIPKKGDRIELTKGNIGLYKKCIQFENESVEEGATGLVINGQEKPEYEFKENYYFMMGDNRHNSLDSRYWGLLPESLLIGKAMYLYWAKNSSRIGKSII